MKIGGRGLAGAMLAVLLFIIGLLGTIVSIGIYQDGIQDPPLLDFFGELFLFVSSLVVLFLAIGSGVLIKQGRQKIIIRILFLCFAVVALFFSIVLFDEPDSLAVLFFPSLMIMHFIFFFFLEALVYATVEDKNSQTAQSLWKESVYAPSILFAVMVFLYILSFYILSH